MTDAARMTDAIFRGDTDAAHGLIAGGLDVNEVDGPHWPPLIQALEHQRTEIVRQLIAAGADVNCDAAAGWTPLCHAIDIESDTASQEGTPMEKASTELLELLLAAGGRPTARAFATATMYRNQRALSLLERAGV